MKRTSLTLLDGSEIRIDDDVLARHPTTRRLRRATVAEIVQGTGVERAVVRWKDPALHWRGGASAGPPTSIVSRYNLYALLLAVALALSACGGDDMPYLDEDAKGCCRCIGPDCPDGGPDDDAGELDAGENLPQDSACDPRLEQCAAELTCRYWARDDLGEPVGVCLPVGAAGAGTECQMLRDPDCGPAMDCFVVGIGLYQECRPMCRVSDPAPRCGELACVPQPQLGADFGHCEAP